MSPREQFDVGLVAVTDSNKTKDVPKAEVPAGNPWYLEVPESNVVGTTNMQKRPQAHNFELFSATYSH